MELMDEQRELVKYVERRNTKEKIVSEIEKVGLKLIKSKFDSTNVRFMDAEAVLNHSLIRIGFRESWENMIREESVAEFFKKLTFRINDIIDSKGEFIMTIPMLYLEFEKE